MKNVIAAIVLISGVLSAPAPQESQSRQVRQAEVSQPSIARYFFNWYPDGEGYQWTYELSDGTIRSEEGKYKEGQDIDGNPTKILVVQGFYSYVGPDGETYWVNYTSGDDGYKPQTGKGVGGPKPGEDASIDPNLLKSLVG